MRRRIDDAAPPATLEAERVVQAWPPPQDAWNVLGHTLARVIPQLTEREQRILYLRYLGGYKPKQVAAALGISRIVERKAHERVLKKLRRLVQTLRRTSTHSSP